MFSEEPAKLIVNRRAIAAGLAALLGAPSATAATLRQLTNVRLSFDAQDFAMQMRDGLFLPNYRLPMARVVFDDGGTSAWHRWPYLQRRGGVSYSGGIHKPAVDTYAIALECCAPDKNGAPRYTQLAIG